MAIATPVRHDDSHDNESVDESCDYWRRPTAVCCRVEEMVFDSVALPALKADAGTKAANGMELKRETR